jgi:hypothetical protein
MRIAKTAPDQRDWPSGNQTIDDTIVAVISGSLSTRDGGAAVAPCLVGLVNHLAGKYRRVPASRGPVEPLVSIG